MKFLHSTKLLLLLLSVFLITSCNSGDGPELIIVHTNDTHSQIDGIYIDEHPVGGITERSSLLELLRKDDPQLIYLDAGDMVQGSPYFNIWNGEVEMKAMNIQGLVASTFGNHEFDNGIDFLCDMLDNACFPILSCNYDVTGTGLEKYVRKSMIIERKSVKIGITGVTVDPNNLIFTKNWEGITFTDPSTAANREARKLKEAGCDLVILLSHVGFYNNDTIGDRLIAANSKDIDLIIGGHTHTNLENGEVVLNANGKPVHITQTGAKTNPIGMVKIKMKPNGIHLSTQKTAFSVKEISCSKLHPDLYDIREYGHVMNEFISPYRDSLSTKMGAVLGHVAKDLTRYRPQSPLGNFVSDVLRNVGATYYGKPVDIGLVNIGGLRNDLNAGDILLGDIYKIFPFENSLTVLELKGSDLEEVIHAMEAKKLEAVSGMQITIQTIDDRTRATDIKIDGKPLDPEKIYSIATIDYLAEGNDGMFALTKAIRNCNTGILLRDIMIDYVIQQTKAGKAIDANLDNRVIELPSVVTNNR